MRVGRRGEAPLVPPYRFCRPNTAMDRDLLMTSLAKRLPRDNTVAPLGSVAPREAAAVVVDV